MIKRKQGLSAVVTTLIIVLLALVAVGLVWIVIQNVINEGVSQIDLSAKCLKLDIKAVSANCANPALCDLTITRNSGGENIAGIKIVFYDKTMGGNIISSSGNLEILETKTFSGATAINSGFVLPTIPNNVKISPYFLDDADNEEICPQQALFNF